MMYRSTTYRFPASRLFSHSALIRIVLFLVCAFPVLVFSSSAQESAWGTQAKEDSINARSERSMQKFRDEMDKILIVDLLMESMRLNTLVKTTPFMQYTPEYLGGAGSYPEPMELRRIMDQVYNNIHYLQVTLIKYIYYERNV